MKKKEIFTCVGVVNGCEVSIELNLVIENYIPIRRNTYTAFGGSFGFVAVRFLMPVSSSSSSSSSLFLSEGISSTSPAALRRRRTAFSNSDITFGLGGLTGSASFDDTEALSPESLSA